MTGMMTLTAFADEISEDLEEQLDVLLEEDIHHLEFRGAWGKNVLRLTDGELARAQHSMRERGIRVSAIGSPIGKILITDEWGPHLREFSRALEIAQRFDVSYIRVFSFFIPQGERAAKYRSGVLERMQELTERAQDAHVVLLHENEKLIYGDVPLRCLDVLEHCGSPFLRAAFDPANFVQCEVRSMQEAWPLLSPYVVYAHIKDALFADGRVVPAGQGDGEVKAFLQALRDRAYSGYLSIEPHLSSGSAFSGFSGPALFHEAVQALKGLLGEIGEEWC